MSMKSLRGMRCVTSNKLLDFGGDTDPNGDPGIFKRNFTIAEQGQYAMA